MGRAPILHCDLDAFYASVEQVLNPDLKGKPVLVGGGVVVAASYEARAYGVSAPTNVRAALAKCPHAVVVPGSFAKYSEYSDQIMGILGDFTPLVEQISIDEAFLDVSGSTHLLGDAAQIGRSIRERVKQETGLPISVGIASSKFLAKVASAAAKPDGLLHVSPENEIEWLHSLPVRVIWGIGPVTESKLFEIGVKTVGELANTPVDSLERWLGRASGYHLHALAWNRDPRHVETTRRAKSIGAQSALGRGLTDTEELSVSAASEVPQAKDVFLLIEVADTTLAYDRTRKLKLYANAGIAEVWIVNMQSKCVEVYREPTEKGYARNFEVGTEDMVSPLALPIVKLAVTEIFA